MPIRTFESLAGEHVPINYSVNHYVAITVIFWIHNCCNFHSLLNMIYNHQCEIMAGNRLNGLVVHLQQPPARRVAYRASYYHS